MINTYTHTHKLKESHKLVNYDSIPQKLTVLNNNTLKQIFKMSAKNIAHMGGDMYFADIFINGKCHNVMLDTGSNNLYIKNLNTNGLTKIGDNTFKKYSSNITKNLTKQQCIDLTNKYNRNHNILTSNEKQEYNNCLVSNKYKINYYGLNTEINNIIAGGQFNIFGLSLLDYIENQKRVFKGFFDFSQPILKNFTIDFVNNLFSINDDIDISKYNIIERKFMTYTKLSDTTYARFYFFMCKSINIFINNNIIQDIDKYYIVFDTGTYYSAIPINIYNMMNNNDKLNITINTNINGKNIQHMFSIKRSITHEYDNIIIIGNYYMKKFKWLFTNSTFGFLQNVKNSTAQITHC